MAAIERSQGCDPDVAEYAERFINHFGLGIGTEIQSVGVSGRVLRGKNLQDFDTLTDVPEKRKVVFLVDSSALDNLVGKSGRQILEEIGYPIDYTDQLLSSGTKFRLAVFPEQSVRLATWDNLLNVVSRVYPEKERDIKDVAGDLPQMEYEEAMVAGGKLTQVRTFLKDTINVNELFMGTGYTPNGQKELVTENKPLADLAPYVLVGFNVE